MFERSLSSRTVDNYIEGAKWFLVECLEGDGERLFSLTSADMSRAVLSLAGIYSPRSVDDARPKPPDLLIENRHP